MPAQKSFNSGVFSPEMFGRTDLEKYPNAVKSMVNMIPLPHGPAIRRPGLEYIASAFGGSAGRTIKLVPFVYSTGQAYMLEFASGRQTLFPAQFRPFYQGGTIDDPGSPGNDLVISGPGASSSTAVPDDSAQSADVMYLAFKNYTQHKVTRTAHDAWAFTTITFTSAPEEWGTSYTVDGVARDGYPSCVCFSNERLLWAGQPSDAQTIWGSKVGVYTDHSVSSPLVADDAITLILSDKQANPIKWISSSNKLAVGTTGSESWITSDSGSGPVTATSKQLIPSGSDGSGDVRPVSVGNTFIFVDQHGKTVRELKYDYSTDSLKGDDLILLAEHLTKHDPIIRIAIQKKPYRLIWAVTESGKLLSGTYYPEHTVIAWAEHETDGQFLDIASMPGDGQDEVWFVIKRGILDSEGRSVDVKYIERLGSFFDEALTEHDKLTGYKIAPYLSDSSLMIDNRLEIRYITASSPVRISIIDTHGYTVGDRVKIRGRIAGDSETEPIMDRLVFVVSLINLVSGYIEVEDEDGNDVDTSAFENIFLGGSPPTAYAYYTGYSPGEMYIAKTFTTLSGLGHLEAHDVDVNADGIIETHTVTSGSVTLDAEASVALAGLPYTSTLEPFHPVDTGPNAQEFNPAQTSRITSIIAQVHKSVGFSMGVGDSSDLYENITPSTPTGEAEALYTGFTKRVVPRCGHGYDQNVIIKQTQSLPLTVIAIHTEIERGD